MPDTPPPPFWGPGWRRRPAQPGWVRWYWANALFHVSWVMALTMLPFAVYAHRDQDTSRADWATIYVAFALSLLGIWGGLKLMPPHTRLWTFGRSLLGTGVVLTVVVIAAAVGRVDYAGFTPWERILICVGLVLAAGGGALMWYFPWHTDWEDGTPRWRRGRHAADPPPEPDDPPSIPTPVGGRDIRRERRRHRKPRVRR